MFVPLSRSWVAKLCLRVWTVTCLSRPALRFQPGRTRATPTLQSKGRSESGRGENQCFGLAAFQYSRRTASKRGESIHLTVSVSFALADADDHPMAINVGDLQGNDLRYAEPGGVSRHEECPIA